MAIQSMMLQNMSPWNYLKNGERKDPIQRMEKYLIENNMASEKEMKEIDERVRDVIDDAEKFAENSPYPDGKEAIEGLYATSIGKGVKGL